MHDGSVIRLHKLEKEWDPLDRISAMNAMQRARSKGEILTGLLYMNPDSADLHDVLETTGVPLNKLTKNELCPGSRRSPRSTQNSANDGGSEKTPFLTPNRARRQPQTQ